jgi:hypothetical protein
MSFTAEKISDMLDDARKEFKEYVGKRGRCDGCKVEDVPRAVHWNDVGNVMCCEACWVDSIVSFWASEEEAVREYEMMNETEDERADT